MTKAVVLWMVASVVLFVILATAGCSTTYIGCTVTKTGFWSRTVDNDMDNEMEDSEADVRQDKTIPFETARGAAVVVGPGSSGTGEGDGDGSEN